MQPWDIHFHITVFLVEEADQNPFFLFSQGCLLLSVYQSQRVKTIPQAQQIFILSVYMDGWMYTCIYMYAYILTHVHTHVLDITVYEDSFQPFNITPP